MPSHFSTSADRVLSATLIEGAEKSLRRPGEFYATPSGSQDSFSVRVLIVEDDEELRALNAMAMTQRGFCVDTADNGEAGWQALCCGNYDLVITDHEMPQLTGLDLIKRMRAESFNLPCILVSGRLPDSDIPLIEIVQPGLVLRKPLKPSQLISESESLLPARWSGAMNGAHRDSAASASRR